MKKFVFFHSTVFYMCMALPLVLSIVVGCGNDPRDSEERREKPSAQTSKLNQITTAPPSQLPFEDYVNRSTRTVIDPRGRTELCSVPSYWDGSLYFEKDVQKALELCGKSLHGPRQFVCHSSNPALPGLNVYPMPGMEDIHPEHPELRLRQRVFYQSVVDRCYSGEPVADAPEAIFLQNAGEVDAHAPILYFHLSRLLGRVGRAPVSVLKTLERNAAFMLARSYFSLPGETDFGFGDHHREYQLDLRRKLRSQEVTENNAVITSNLTMSFGSFVDLESRDATKHPDFGAINSQEGFWASTGAQLVTSKRALDRSQLPQRREKAFENSLYGVLLARDVSDLVILDFLLGRKSRFDVSSPGLSAKVFGYAKVDERDFIEVDLDHLPQQLQSTLEQRGIKFEDIPLNARVPRVVFGVETDLFNAEPAFTVDDLNNVNHLSPDTYKRLIWMHNNWTDIKSYLITESGLQYRPETLDKLESNLMALVDILVRKCAEGSLHLDLDVRAMWDSTYTESCLALNTELSAIEKPSFFPKSLPKAFPADYQKLVHEGRMTQDQLTAVSTDHPVFAWPGGLQIQENVPYLDPRGRERVREGLFFPLALRDLTLGAPLKEKRSDVNKTDRSFVRWCSVIEDSENGLDLYMLSAPLRFDLIPAVRDDEEEFNMLTRVKLVSRRGANRVRIFSHSIDKTFYMVTAINQKMSWLKGIKTGFIPASAVSCADPVMLHPSVDAGDPVLN